MKSRPFGLSKSRVIAHRQCAKRLWLQTYRPELLDESGSGAVFAFGNEVGAVARQLHPGGVLIEGETLQDALQQTRTCLAETPRHPLFEATFDYDGTLVRADLLLPSGDDYRMVEVKASTSVKPHYPEDVAVQAWVLQNAGVPLDGLELAHVDNSFVYPGNGNYEGLLHYEDVATDAGALIGEVPDWIGAARATLGGGEPDIDPGPQCYDPYECPFTAYCIPAMEPGSHPVDELPYGGKTAERLTTEGFTDLTEVPAELLSNPRHIMVHQAVNSGEVYFDREAAGELAGCGWPRRYLDFETIRFAVPSWAGTRPYQQIPFQWSCHVETEDGSLEHHEFLADAGDDPRRTFAESLIDVVGRDDGPIFVYNAAFECTRIKELATALPDLDPVLSAILDRIVDLLPITRQYYYHPDQRGSWSLKAVLPTIAPDLDYDELEVSDGGSASEAFRSLFDPDLPAAEAERRREALLEYCSRDTLALVRIVHFFRDGAARRA